MTLHFLVNTETRKIQYDDKGRRRERRFEVTPEQPAGKPLAWIPEIKPDLEPWQVDGGLQDPAPDLTGVPHIVGTIPLADYKARLKGSVNAQASQRINAVAPEWRQRNAIAAGVFMLNKVRGGETLSVQEEQDAAAAEALWQMINPIRAASNVASVNIDAAADHATAKAAADAVVWP